MYTPALQLPGHDTQQQHDCGPQVWHDSQCLSVKSGHHQEQHFHQEVRIYSPAVCACVHACVCVCTVVGHTWGLVFDQRRGDSPGFSTGTAGACEEDCVSCIIHTSYLRHI